MNISKKHIMLDIETMGTGSNAVVVSISAIIFDMATGELGDTFEIGLDMKEQTLKGGEIDQDTVNWWAKQSDEAKAELDRLDKKIVEVALERFNQWISDNFPAPSKIKLWGNGATFDNVIVRNLFKRHDIKFVIPYYADKDVRTLTYLTKTNARKFEFEGIKHRGIDDCKHQIKYCVDGYQKIQKALESI